MQADCAPTGRAVDIVETCAAANLFNFGQAGLNQLVDEFFQILFELCRFDLILGKQRIARGCNTSEEDVFIACSSPKGYSFAAYRVDGELKHPKLVVDKLSGCCSQMDLGVRDGKLWVAHNGRHRVECFDREGKKLASFGKTSRREADGFGGCCEPKNIRLAANGEVFAAESGPPVAIKRFTPEGKFLGVVAVPTFDTGCVRVTVDISPDGETFYLLDTGSDAIHAFVANKSGN